MELFIIALTLVVAVYAVVPRERQLELRFSLGTVDFIVFVLGFLAALYLEFYDAFSFYGLALQGIHWPHGINRNNGMLLVIIVLIAFFSLRLRTARLSVANIHAFRDLCEELLWAEDFATLFGLLQKHSKNLFKILRGDLVSSRLRERFTPANSFEEFLREGSDLRPRESALSRWLAHKLSPAVRLLPAHEKEIAAAKRGVPQRLFVRGLRRIPCAITAIHGPAHPPRLGRGRRSVPICGHVPDGDDEKQAQHSLWRNSEQPKSASWYTLRSP
jgi:hypothetical protein